MYAATDNHVAKLTAELSLEAEQAAKNLPSTNEMIQALGAKAPPAALQPLRDFKQYSWSALNSYVHSGIHALKRQETGYPVQLLEQCLKQSNAIAIVASMQAAILTGNQQLVKQVGALQQKYQYCLPPAL